MEEGATIDSRNGMTQEVIGWSGKLLDPTRNFLTNERRALDPSYACAELLWYLSRSNDITMIKAYAPQYETFAEPNTHNAYGAYGYRIVDNVIRGPEKLDQLFYAAHKLTSKPDTRQCIVSLWRPDDLIQETRRDVPCTICLQFLLREKKLHMITYMRSNDVWLGMPYDVFCFTSIQMLMAGTLGVGVGTYTHNVGSMHLYQKNRLAAGEIFDKIHLEQSPPHKSYFNSIFDAQKAVKLEAEMRYGDPHNLETKFSDTIGEVSFLSDCVRCCARKFGGIYNPISPAFTKGFINVDNRRS